MAKHTKGFLSNRQLRVGELVRHGISEQLLRESFFESPLADSPITVTEVRMSTDLRNATVFVLPFAKNTDSEAVMKDLSLIAARFQGPLGRKLGLKYTPKLHFQIDDTVDRVDRIDELLRRSNVRNRKA